MEGQDIQLKKKSEISFSVIIIFGKYVKNIDFYLKKYLDFMDKFEIEIILVSEDIQSLKVSPSMKKLNLKLINSDSNLPSEKRNIGVKKSSNNYIVFIDDDAYPSKEYFDNAYKIISKGYSIFGGPQIAPLEKNNFISDLSDSFYSSKMVNPFNFRYSIINKEKKIVNELPTVNFIIDKVIFNKVGGFDKKYWPGEDTILCDRINNYSKIYYFNTLFVHHARRDTLMKHFRQISRYGFNRGKLIFKLKKVFSFLYFLPLFFLILFMPLILNINLKIMIFIIPYLLLISFNNYFKKKKLLQSILLPLFSFISIFLYGFNFLLGLFDFSDKNLPKLGR